MKPTVKLIEGRHIATQDKRNILECIDYLETQPPSEEPQWLRRGKSSKRDAIVADPEQTTRYTVHIREAYRTDFGDRRESTKRVVVEIKG